MCSWFVALLQRHQSVLRAVVCPRYPVGCGCSLPLLSLCPAAASCCLPRACGSASSCWRCAIVAIFNRIELVIFLLASSLWKMLGGMHHLGYAPRRSPHHDYVSSFLRTPVQELVKSIDALSRDQLRALLVRLGLQNLAVPVVIPGANRWAWRCFTSSPRSLVGLFFVQQRQGPSSLLPGRGACQTPPPNLRTQP